MKALILKIVLPPLFLFIIYYNLNFFVFSFEAREGYLNKRLKKADTEIAELKKEINQITGDKKNKTYEELSKTLKELEGLKKSTESLFLEPVNIYKEFEDNKLTLISEQSVKSVSSEIKNLTNFTVTGNYTDVIKILKSISDSELVPVIFTLNASTEELTRYSISVWNRNEQF